MMNCSKCRLFLLFCVFGGGLFIGDGVVGWMW